ncbi:GNAT family N-acetyltransferase [Vibrio sp. SCSIO 43169]|uniref:GNAT family N-acetyltransferase n=1 Tax=Vibrio sp. SCSIO 43169 TaxID=2822801 RepID=UPI0020434CD7|nr:GNAT family N-acetyltransferase [Vibrio sp. SCSIO 43169]MCM5510037.1 GNAT family N-acetyltransferase [Vibrio sp. SCSIO 43169]
MYLKPATVEDAPLFVGMERASGTKEFVIPYDLETHQTLIVDQDVIYLSVMDPDELVGFMILRQDDTKSVEFRRIVIEKQGRGYGQRTLQAMEDYCFHQLGSHGFGSMCLLPMHEAYISIANETIPNSAVMSIKGNVCC